MILMFEDQRLSAFTKVDVTWSIYDIHVKPKLIGLYRALSKYSTTQR